MIKIIKLPVGGIEVSLAQSGDATITSELHEEPSCVSEGIENYRSEYDAAIDGLESLILAHACAGIDISQTEYVEGIRTAVEAITNNPG